MNYLSLPDDFGTTLLKTALVLLICSLMFGLGFLRGYHYQRGWEDGVEYTLEQAGRYMDVKWVEEIK